MKRVAIVMLFAAAGCGGRVASTGDGAVTDSAGEVSVEYDVDVVEEGYDSGYDVGFFDEGYDSGIDFGVEDVADAPTPVDVGCVPHPRPEECMNEVCGVQKAACEVSSTCVASYNTWGNCMRDCGMDDAACPDACSSKLVDAKAADLARCVVYCATCR